MRIFVYMHYLELGGAETALIGMLNALSTKDVEVELFLGSVRGELVKKIPPQVKLLAPKADYDMLERPIVEVFRRGMWRLGLNRLKAKWHYRKYTKDKRPQDGSAIFGYIGKYVTPTLSSLRQFGHYDLAISYLHPHDIVASKVDAQIKACWIHTDYSKIDIDTRIETPVWDSYDHIIAVSDDAGEQFAKKFPTLAHKISTIENILSPTLIREAANVEIEDWQKQPGQIRLLTIGRYCEAKRLDAIPAICRRLRDRGLDISWAIIGYGGDGQYIKDAISRESMCDHVHMLGKKENPYPYIASCDWYVQPSLYEGKSIVVREAQTLNKPVIVTEYATSHSQIEDGVDGIIVPMEIEQCSSAMTAAISDKSLSERLIQHLSTHDYGSASEAQKVLDLVY